MNVYRRVLIGCLFVLAPVRAMPLERPVPRLHVTGDQAAGGVEGAAAATGFEGARLLFAIEPNALVTARITLANSGDAGSSLAWEISSSSTGCAVPSPAPWLGAEPALGRLGAGATIEAAIYASSFAAAEGMRRGFLCIRSSDPVDPVVALPVTLIVDAAPSRRTTTIRASFEGGAISAIE